MLRRFKVGEVRFLEVFYVAKFLRPCRDYEWSFLEESSTHRLLISEAILNKVREICHYVVKTLFKRWVTSFKPEGAVFFFLEKDTVSNNFSDWTRFLIESSTVLLVVLHFSFGCKNVN